MGVRLVICHRNYPLSVLAFVHLEPRPILELVDSTPSQSLVGAPVQSAWGPPPKTEVLVNDVIETATSIYAMGKILPI